MTGSTPSPAPRALVYGTGIASLATARALLRRSYDVVLADDIVTPERRGAADALGLDLLEAPDAGTLATVMESCELVSPAPGVPETHRVVEVAIECGVELVTELELAYRWEQERPEGPRPMLAVTGTDGKTTTTLMAVAMLRAAGLTTVDAGNTDTPLVDAVDDESLDAFVVECASFRLAWTPTFRADAAVWLNLAPDHLNWHRSMRTYEDAKFRIWANQTPDDAAIGFVDDPTVMRRLADASGRQRTFGASGADYRLEGTMLTGPAGAIVDRSVMRRSLPHDVTNALAASALVLESGLAQPEAIGRALADFNGPPHRLEFVGSWGGADWYNDSKATTPHAAAVAIAAFDDIVLIAGGKDKHVDLGEMAVDASRIRAVIAIGETADAVLDAFAEVDVRERCVSLADAVAKAADQASAGRTVLLSPGCASLDQYPSFEARGDEFRELVRARHDAAAADDAATAERIADEPPTDDRATDSVIAGEC